MARKLTDVQMAYIASAARGFGRWDPLDKPTARTLAARGFLRWMVAVCDVALWRVTSQGFSVIAAPATDYPPIEPGQFDRVNPPDGSNYPSEVMVIAAKDSRKSQ